MNTNANSSQPKHSYPLKIALRAQRLIQASLFYGAFVDTAVGKYVRVTPNADEKVKKVLLEGGWTDVAWETGWSCFEEYMNEFQHPVFQFALYSIIIHWDWYISRLGKFVDFAESHVAPRKHRDKKLSALSFKPVREQIDVLQITMETKFSFNIDILDLVEEMNLVRNLGMHNEWEVDETYLKWTKNKTWKIGQQRTFEITELTNWHSAIIQLINVISLETAIRYTKVPKYD